MPKTNWKNKIARLNPETSVELQHRANPEIAKTSTVRYLERVRDLIAKEEKMDRAAVSNYKVAQRLNIAPNRMSQYFGHGGTMENKLACQVADVLGLDPLKVIADVEADRATRDEDKSFWKELAKKVAFVAIVAVGATLGAPAPSSAANASPACVLCQMRRPCNCKAKAAAGAWFLPLLTLLGIRDPELPA